MLKCLCQQSATSEGALIKAQCACRQRSGIQPRGLQQLRGAVQPPMAQRPRRASNPVQCLRRALQ